MVTHEVNTILNSHVSPETPHQGIISGHTHPPFTFTLEHYNDKMSIECYKDGEWTHTIKSPDVDVIGVEKRFTDIIEAYVSKTLDEAEPDRKLTFKEYIVMYLNMFKKWMLKEG